MDLPDVLEDGRSHALRRRISPSMSRIGWPILVVAGAVWVVTSLSSGEPSTPPLPQSSTSLDVRGDEQVAVASQLSVADQRDARIRDVPAAYRDAAGRASAMHGGRTPGNFFLALAFHRTWYGELLSGSEGVRYVPFGPVQWDPSEFARYADPGHRDINDVLGSFLAIDNALHTGHRPDFSNGVFGPSRQLGMDRAEASSVAAIYDTLDGWGVRAGSPR